MIATDLLGRRVKWKLAGLDAIPAVSTEGNCWAWPFDSEETPEIRCVWLMPGTQNPTLVYALEGSGGRLLSCVASECRLLPEENVFL